jgi:predicted TIM-barrel fold metal-dependent hydrolase
MGPLQRESSTYIDAHVHVWTSDLQKYPIAAEHSASDMVPAQFHPEDLMRQCKAHGVDRIVLIQMSFYSFDNRYMLDCISQYPQTFAGVAIIDENEPHVATTIRELKSQGVRGLRLYSDAAHVAKWSDSKSMRKLWQVAADEAITLCLLADPEALPSIDGMCQKFPETRVAIDHFARIGMRGPIEEAPMERLGRLAKYPNTFLKTSAFYALGKKVPPYLDIAEMFRQMYDAFGAERMLWGSDCPYQLEGMHTYEASLSLIRDRLDYLTTAERDSILSKTAEKLFFA